MAGYMPLTEDIRKRVIGGNAVDPEEENIFEDHLTKLLNLTDGFVTQNKQYIVLKTRSDKKWTKPARHTNKKLSYQERRKLGLYSVGRKSLKYEDLLPLHSLWKDYIRKYVGYEALNAAGQHEDSCRTAIGYKLYRADYHGAEFCVKRSVCPSYVGVSGIVVMETKFCFLLLGKDNVTRRIPKHSSEFSFEIDKFKLSIFGKNLLSRSAERSSRKIKTVYPPCL